MRTPDEDWGQYVADAKAGDPDWAGWGDAADDLVEVAKLLRAGDAAGALALIDARIEHAADCVIERREEWGTYDLRPGSTAAALHGMQADFEALVGAIRATCPREAS